MPDPNPSPRAAAQAAAPDPSNAAALERLLEAAARAFGEGRFERLLLSGPRTAAGDDAPQRVSLRLVRLRGQLQLSLVEHHTQRDHTRNLAPDQAWSWVRARIGTDFANAHLLTRDEELQLALSRKGRYSLRRSRRVAPEHGAADGGDPAAGNAVAAEAGAAPTAQEAAGDAAAHNRARRYPLALTRPFLAELGVTDAQQRLVPAMARKWRQINRFVDIMAGAIAASPLAGRTALRIVDFGAGKGYLSFALHDHLRALGIDAQLSAVELRPELVAAGNAIVARLALQGMRFEASDIARYPLQPIDLLIALHACDTATDQAIHYGIRAGAAIVCCAPCCHRELRPQLLRPQPLRALLRHGVHLGQEAEMLTDTLRALLLEACGYDAQVFEFVSLEHTAKNKMILAVRRAQPQPAEPVLAQLDELRAFYGVRDQCLLRLLRADGRLPPRASTPVPPPAG